MRLSGWGRYPVADVRAIEARGEAETVAAVAASPQLIARGAGRAYGDAALNPAGTLCMGASDRMIAFDPATGALTCEAGVLLKDVVQLFAPRGWFPRVTPGTWFVTVGGMIASDVHGKNHHVEGSFGGCLDWIDLATAEGGVVRCSREQNAELFASTLGGMGLTGVILRAHFRLRPIETRLMRQRVVRAPNLKAAFELFDAHRDSPYSVGWTDCLASGEALGRSVIYLADHARADEAPSQAGERGWRRAIPGVPVDAPAFALNRLTVGLFNQAYWSLPRQSEGFVGLEPYFYPLDAIGGWNRLYGARGFVQYQCALPKAAAYDGIAALLTRISRAGGGSFLSVLKLLGAEGEGMLSFPLEGYTLALDFPVNRRNLDLLDELDRIVADHSGRIYLAKDARAPADLVAAGYPRLEEFRELRARTGATGRFESLMSQRLGL